MYFDEPAEGFYDMPYELRVVLGGLRPVQHPVLRLSGAAGRRRRAPPRIPCSDAARPQRGCGGRPASSPLARSARPIPRRWLRGAARRSAGRCGSPRGSRPRAAAGVDRPGFRRPAISMPACCCAIRRRSSARRNSPSSPRLALRDAIVADAPALAREACASNGRTMCCSPGKKCAGILIEGERVGRKLATSSSASASIARTIPPDTAYPATDLHSHGAAVDCRNNLFTALVRRRCARASRNGDRGDGFAGILADWLAARARHRRGDRRPLTEPRKARPLCRRSTSRPADPRLRRRRHRRRSRPATCFRSTPVPARAGPAWADRWRKTNLSSRRSAASARSG